MKAPPRKACPTPARPALKKGAAERAEVAFGMSLRGFSVRAIAEELGVSSTAVNGYIQAGRKSLNDSIQHDARERLADRHAALYAILEAAWGNYRNTGALAALELVRKTEADLRKLYGDDAPTKQQTEFSGEVKGGAGFLTRDQLIADIKAAKPELAQAALAKQGGRYDAAPQK